MTECSDYSVAFAVHDAYAGPTAVAATSIVANSSSSFHFYILDLGLSAASREQLAKVVGTNRLTIVRLPEEFTLEGVALSEELHAKRLGKEMYAKFYLPELLLDRCDRFVYLDCDTLTVGDLSPLFHMRLDPYTVAGVSCLHSPVVSSPEGLPDFEKLGLAADTPCLDTGMLVVDTQAFTRQRIGHLALEYGRSHSSLPLGDLNALCAVLRGQWRQLGFEWNFQVYEPLRERYNGPLPITYHFSGRHKPFLLGSKFPDMQIMYDAYRQLCVTAGGPPF